MQPTHDELITDLSEIFDAKPMSQRKSELYAASLAAIPEDHLAVVVQRIIDTRQSGFMPTPGEIKEEYVSLLLGRPMPDERLQWCLDEDRRMEGEAQQDYYAKPVTSRGMFLYRRTAPVEFPDPVTAEAVRLCGWSELVEMDREFRAQFWAKKYALARESVAKRIQAGEVRLALPTPENVRPIKAVAS